MKLVKFLFLYAIFLGSVFGIAQNQRADSLVLAVKNTHNDIDKAQLLNNIAEEYKTDNPKLMLRYANQALQLATKINFPL